MGLKIFWGSLATIIISGLLYLFFAGLPVPSVEVHKKINLDMLTKRSITLPKP